MDSEEFFNRARSIASESVYVVTNEIPGEGTATKASLWVDGDELPDTLQHEDIEIVRERVVQEEEPIPPALKYKDPEDVNGRTRFTLELNT